MEFCTHVPRIIAELSMDEIFSLGYDFCTGFRRSQGLQGPRDNIPENPGTPGKPLEKKLVHQKSVRRHRTFLQNFRV